MSDDLVYLLRKRAEIRRSIDTRKSVQNNEPDRIADLLEESADRIVELEKRCLDEITKRVYAERSTEVSTELLLEKIAELEKTPQKYCPSENNEAYEKGFIDGMQKQMQSSVDKALERESDKYSTGYWNGIAKAKEFTQFNTQLHPLTDEEIEEVMMRVGYGEVHKFVNPFDFARAIEKKVRGEQ
jgi:hypothetical protein